MPGTVRGTREPAVGKTGKVPASRCPGSGGGDRQASIGSLHICYRGRCYGERLAGQGHVCENGREMPFNIVAREGLAGGDMEQSPDGGVVEEREQPDLGCAGGNQMGGRHLKGLGG